MPPIDHSAPEFAALLGEAIVAMSYSMCGVAKDAVVPVSDVVQGYNKLAPEYVRVTEGRDGPTPEIRKNYSSCGDQLHAILERLGVRMPFLNRATQKGGWVSGANITRLQKPACPFAVTPPVDGTYRPPPGSLCLIWTTGYDAHALVILGSGSDAKHIRTGNYGAGGMSESISPGANVADSPCVWDDTRKKLLIGGSKRGLRTVITPTSIVPYITAQIDLSGCPVTGELVDALGARYDSVVKK